MSDAIVVFMTAGSADEARRIAQELVESRLAVCVQILPEIESVYRWNDEVQREKEVLLLAKTTADRFAALDKSVRAIHSYQTPQIVAVPVAAISEPYHRWLIQNVSATAGG
jgi:periplasmic divalent cation tolerance protein